MKQVTFAVGLLAVGLALGLVMPGVLAQAPQAEVQKWEQFCERPGGGDRVNKRLEALNESMKAHGAEGWELVGLGEPSFVCYRRPAR